MSSLSGTSLVYHKKNLLENSSHFLFHLYVFVSRGCATNVPNFGLPFRKVTKLCHKREFPVYPKYTEKLKETNAHMNRILAKFKIEILLMPTTVKI